MLRSLVALALLLAACAAHPAMSVVHAGLLRSFDTFDGMLKDLNMSYDQLFPGPPNPTFVYTYSQSSGRFTGPAFDGGQINVIGCSGLSGENKCGEGNCRNNPQNNCCKDCGPCPRGQWRLSQEVVYKGMPHCYALTLVSGGCANRGGFLIHGGACSANPSDGCIVIENENIRYKIKGGAILHVVE
eukprot:m.241980 g.241980  ORF g.241980 m.241980 type:complete len:186 (+) comp13942_c0_seq1:13-570(+)